MEPWQKGAPAVKKMTKGAQASYFKRFPDREDWFRQNHPDMAHFDTSVKQASKAKAVDKVALEKKSLKAYGATRGTATGGEGGNADAPPRDTIAPMSRETHSKVQQAKREAEAATKPAKPPKAEKKPAAAKPVDRMALIRAAAKKSQSAAAKEKRASQFDAPTFDPDDTDHDDYASAHYGMHQYREEVEQIAEEGVGVDHVIALKKPIGTYTHAYVKGLHWGPKGVKLTVRLHHKDTPPGDRRYGPEHEITDHKSYTRVRFPGRLHLEEVGLEEGKMKSAAADNNDDKGHEDFEATLSHAVKMAKGVAFDKRYKGGNMTGAVRAIRAIGKKYGMHGLEDHPEVSSALRRANEELEINEMDSEGYKGHRDNEDSGKGPEKLAKQVTKKQAAKDALKVLADRVRSSRESTNEEVEYIEERLSKSDPASTWISHFVSSENPMFSGKTKKERINMALGAYYKAKRAAPKNEEVEIDESKHEGRTPESEEETELAKHHGDPKKITYGDVVKARIASAKRKKSED